MKTGKTKITDMSLSNYEKYEKGSTRLLIPPEPRAMLEELRKASGVSYQVLTDIAICQLYERVMNEGKLSFTITREVNINVKK